MYGSKVISENKRELKKMKKKLEDESSAKDLLWTRMQLGPFSLSPKLYDLMLLLELAPSETVAWKFFFLCYSDKGSEVYFKTPREEKNLLGDEKAGKICNKRGSELLFETILFQVVDKSRESEYFLRKTQG